MLAQQGGDVTFRRRGGSIPSIQVATMALRIVRRLVLEMVSVGSAGHAPVQVEDEYDGSSERRWAARRKPLLAKQRVHTGLESR